MAIRKVFGSIILLSLSILCGCGVPIKGEEEMHTPVESIDNFYADNDLYIRYDESLHKLEVIDNNVYKEYRTEGSIVLMPIEESIYNSIGCTFGNLIIDFENNKVTSVIDKDNTVEASLYRMAILPCPQWSNFKDSLQVLTESFGNGYYEYSVDINGRPFLFTESSIYYMSSDNMVGSIDRTIDVEKLDYFDYIRNATENKIRFNRYVRDYYNTEVDFAYFTPSNRLYILKEGELVECN